MRVQDLRDTEYEKKSYFSHKRGWLKKWSWEYCIKKDRLDDIARFEVTLGGEDQRSVNISLGLLGVSAYLHFHNILPESKSVGWFERNGVRNPRWHEDSHGRVSGFYITRESISINWNHSVIASGKDTSIYGYHWYWFMPTTWDHVRTDVLTADGKLVTSSHEQVYAAARKARKKNPKVTILDFKEEDFPDHRHIQTVDYTYTLKSGEIQRRKATFYVTEMEWRLRLFSKLPFRFGPKKVRRSISVSFDGEVGERTGSWKGGTVGCGYDLRPGETPLDCLRRMEVERKF